MIQKETIIQIIDNSGARKGLCIWIEKKKKKANAGTEIKLVIKQIQQKNANQKEHTPIKKGQMFPALIVCTKKNQTSDQLPITLEFSKNAAILLTTKKEPLGSKINGPLNYYALKKKKKFKVLSLAFAHSI